MDLIISHGNENREDINSPKPLPSTSSQPNLKFTLVVMNANISIPFFVSTLYSINSNLSYICFTFFIKYPKFKKEKKNQTHDIS